MSIKTIYVTVGVPLSGKSTWAKNKCTELRLSGQNCAMISLDEYRLRFFGEKPYKSGFNVKEEGFVIKSAFNDLEGLIRYVNVIFDATNLTPKDYERFESIGREYGCNVVYQIFDLPSKCEIVKRNNQRFKDAGVYIPTLVIRNFIKRYKEMLESPPKDFLFDTKTLMNKVDARITNGTNVEVSENEYVITDLDGTLSLMNGRSPYSGSDCVSDVVNHSVLSLLNKYDGRVIIVSGRNSDNGGKEATESWLKANGIAYERLFMRKPGDKRPDTTIKQEIYNDNIKDKFNVAFVLDDRDVVVDFWRKKCNLNCFQVNYGNF